MVKLKNLSFSGRSVLGMLTSLAVIVFLSWGVVVTYRYFSNKRLVKLTLYDIVLHTTAVRQSNYRDLTKGYVFSFPDLRLRMETELSMDAVKESGSSFLVNVRDVPKALCRGLLEAKSSEIRAVQVNSYLFVGNYDICHSKSFMSFCFSDNNPESISECSSEGKCKGSVLGECDERCNPETGIIEKKYDGALCSIGACKRGLCVDLCRGVSLGECEESCDSSTGVITNRPDDTPCGNSGAEWCSAGGCLIQCGDHAQWLGTACFCKNGYFSKTGTAVRGESCLPCLDKSKNVGTGNVACICPFGEEWMPDSNMCEAI